MSWAKTELAVYLTGLYSGHATSQLTFSWGTWLHSTLEPGYGDVLAFLWGFSAVPFESDMMKFGGNPWGIWGQLGGLPTTEATVTGRDTVAKAFARWYPAIHYATARKDFSCSGGALRQLPRGAKTEWGQWCSPAGGGRTTNPSQYPHGKSLRFHFALKDFHI